MSVTIERYTKDRIPDVLREKLRARHIDTLIALTASNEEAQRFYQHVPDSQMHDVGIWINIK